jgi:CheY-like chemotaxis protein
MDTGDTRESPAAATPRRMEGQAALAAIAGGLAHELNNLLSSVIMMVDLLRGSCTLERDQTLLTAMEESARRGVHLVRQMHWLASGVEDGCTLFQPRHLLLDVLKMATASVPAAVAVAGDFPADLWLLRGDPVRFYRACLDLCLEARDRLTHGGELALKAWNTELDEVAATQRPGLAAGPHLALELARDGAETDSPPLAASLFAGFGGVAEALPRAGGGQVFRVLLPAVRPPAEETLTGGESQDGRGELVLVVETDDAVREALTGVLERHGYRHLAAADGAEAVALFAQRAEETAALVVGADLRFLEGPAVLRAVRRLRAGVPAVATGTPRELAAWPAGPAPWIPLAKPFGADALLAALREALRSGS